MLRASSWWPTCHGAYDELTALLQAAGVIDAGLGWRGGATTLVSLGDLLDRGPQSRKVMDLLMRLQRDATAAGGAVHVVLGNHEAMNLTGDLRYVSAQEYAAFAGEESDDVRAAAYARFTAEQPAHAPPEQTRSAFERRYPPGYFAHRAAFGADGTYGSWLLSLPALIVIGDTAFVHGGLPAMVASTSAADLNARIQDSLRRQLTAPEPEPAISAAQTNGAGETVVASEASGARPRRPALVSRLGVLQRVSRGARARRGARSARCRACGRGPHAGGQSARTRAI